MIHPKLFLFCFLVAIVIGTIKSIALIPNSFHRKLMAVTAVLVVGFLAVRLFDLRD